MAQGGQQGSQHSRQRQVDEVGSQQGEEHAKAQAPEATVGVPGPKFSIIIIVLQQR